jgi:thiol-disulfide isomerase/thioredoxin
MWSKILNVLLVAAVLLLVYNMFIKTPNIEHGEVAPSIETELIDGSTFRMDQLKGNYVLVDFWASWCGPCIKDSPKVVNLFNKFHDKTFKDADNFEVVSVALEKREGSWEKMAKRFGFAWDYQIVDIVQFVRLSPFANAYDVTEIPTKFLINPDGNIIGVDLPAEDIDRLLTSRLQ